MTRLLVVRLGSLGDLVHTLPAVSAIKRAQPDLEIDWLVDAVHEDFLGLVPILSSVVTLRERTIGGWWRARRTLRSRHYDAAIDFQGLVKSAVLARLSGARRVIGFERGGLRERGAAHFYTERADVGEGRHVIDKNLVLASVLGAEPGRLEFPLRHARSPVAETLLAQVQGTFALLNCGAAWPNKRWPPERFGRIAGWLHETRGWTSIVLWGPGEEQIAAEVARASNGTAIAAPRTGLVDLVELSRHARLMISGDTGPTHIAAAVGTPLVALFGPTDPDRNGPWNRDDVAVSRYEHCTCHYLRACQREPADWCLGHIREEDVRHAVERRLARGDVRSAQS